jgi:hypothetical protein
VAAHIENEVLIGAPVDLTWRLANDIEHWPDLFGEYASVRLLHRDGAASRFRLTAPPDARGRELSCSSSCRSGGAAPESAAWRRACSGFRTSRRGRTPPSTTRR